MSSNSFTWVTEGGDLGTADWSCLAGRCASLCLRYTNWRPVIWDHTVLHATWHRWTHFEAED